VPRKKRTLIVVGKVREFDEAAWKRLLLAYAYHLHDERMRTQPPAELVDDDSPEDRGENT
jgi:hypothetical protein